METNYVFKIVLAPKASDYESIKELVSEKYPSNLSLNYGSTMGIDLFSIENDHVRYAVWLVNPDPRFDYVKGNFFKGAKGVFSSLSELESILA